MTYQLYCAMNSKAPNAAFYVNEKGGMTSFLFDPANPDYAKFKDDLANGAELQDAEGNAMAATDIQTFLVGLK